MTKHIEYRPEIDYTLKEAPANEFMQELLLEEKYISPDEVKEEVKKNKVNIDYLLYKCEEKLKNKEVNKVQFEDYKKLAIKKYYCQQMLSNSEEILLETFENEMSGLNGEITGEVYPRLLALKKDIEDSLNYVNNLIEIDTEHFTDFLQDLSRRYSNVKSYTENINGNDELKNNLSNQLIAINNQLLFYQKQKAHLKEQYEKAIDEGYREKAKILKKEIDKIDSKINEITSSLSFATSQSYIYHQKALNTDSYLKKAGYLIMATPFDHLDGKVCCMLKLFIRTLYNNDDNYMQRFQEDIELDKTITFGNKKYTVQELKQAIDAIRGLLAITYGKDSKMAKRLVNEITNLILSPVKSVLNMAINELRDFETKIIKRVTGLFDTIADLDPENPNNLLDCMYLESFADIIYDVIEELFADIEQKLIDLYKFVYKQKNKFKEDIVVIGKKEKIRQLYNLLTKFSKALQTLEEISFRSVIEEWVESFLIKSGYGTKFNPQTGRIEQIQLDGCIDQGKYRGRYLGGNKDFDDIETLPFESMPDYQQFIEKLYPLSYNCSI